MAQPQKSNRIAATPMFNSHCPKKFPKFEHDSGTQDSINVGPPNYLFSEDHDKQRLCGFKVPHSFPSRMII